MWRIKKEKGAIQPGQNIWGSWSRYQIRSRVENAATKKLYDPNTGKQIGRSVVYSSIHDMRKASIEYWDKLFVYNEREWPRERLVSAMLWHVNFELPDDEGKMHLPLNPNVKKRLCEC